MFLPASVQGCAELKLRLSSFSRFFFLDIWTYNDWSFARGGVGVLIWFGDDGDPSPIPVRFPTGPQLRFVHLMQANNHMHQRRRLSERRAERER